MKLGRTTPILRIFDEAKAKEFYLGFLGFCRSITATAARVRR